ncbi:MAG TPA: GNAT family N-acetyltransferase [Solirubrobacteraceae bacterium]|nr:GNAT family N-acetyltransferase [Solirubrobacteraceae bacterium]
MSNPIRLPGEPLSDGPTTLRPWRESDLTAIVTLCRDPEIARWTRVPANYTEADGRVFLARRHDMAHAGLLAPFAIVSDGPDGELLGSISLLRFVWAHRRAEVGYWLGRSARGAGHATRAVGLICRWGFARLDLERIDLLASTGNAASQAVAQRAGFTREAVLRSSLNLPSGRQDVVCFGLLAG